MCSHFAVSSNDIGESEILPINKYGKYQFCEKLEIDSELVEVHVSMERPELPSRMKRSTSSEKVEVENESLKKPAPPFKRPPAKPSFTLPAKAETSTPDTPRSPVTSFPSVKAERPAEQVKTPPPAFPKLLSSAPVAQSSTRNRPFPDISKDEFEEETEFRSASDPQPVPDVYVEPTAPALRFPEIQASDLEEDPIIDLVTPPDRIAEVSAPDVFEYESDDVDDLSDGSMDDYVSPESDSDLEADIGEVFQEELTPPKAKKSILSKRASKAKKDAPYRKSKSIDDSEAINFMKVRKTNRKTLAKKEAKRWKKRAAIVAAAVGVPLVAVLTVFQFNVIPSHSMAPTVGHNDFVVSMRFADKTPQIGDVVVFSGSGTDWGDSNYIKRVMGLEGQIVSCCDSEGLLTIDGEPVEESYLLDADMNSSNVSFKVKVAEGSFLALGDNRNASKDSRYFFDQSVPVSNIKGKPLFGFSFDDMRFYKL